jgi:hypothetical protein
VAFMACGLYAGRRLLGLMESSGHQEAAVQPLSQSPRPYLQSTE